MRNEEATRLFVRGSLGHALYSTPSDLVLPSYTSGVNLLVLLEGGRAASRTSPGPNRGKETAPI